MNGLERVCAALRHDAPDRVPLGEAEIDEPIVSAVLGRPTLYAAKFDLLKAIQDEESLADLKRLHGGKLALWGGVSCRLLDTGTPDQIREMTRSAIETAAPGGGFILGSSHSLGVGVNHENYMAMLETWAEYR